MFSASDQAAMGAVCNSMHIYIQQKLFDLKQFLHNNYYFLYLIINHKSEGNLLFHLFIHLKTTIDVLLIVAISYELRMQLAVTFDEQ